MDDSLRGFNDALKRLYPSPTPEEYWARHPVARRLIQLTACRSPESPAMPAELVREVVRG